MEDVRPAVEKSTRYDGLDVVLIRSGKLNDGNEKLYNTVFDGVKDAGSTSQFMVLYRRDFFHPQLSDFRRHPENCT